MEDLDRKLFRSMLIRAARETKLAWIAVCVGCSDTAVSYHIKGIRTPSFTLLCSYCRFLGIPMEALLTGTDQNILLNRKESQKGYLTQFGHKPKDNEHAEENAVGQGAGVPAPVHQADVDSVPQGHREAGPVGHRRDG